MSETVPQEAASIVREFYAKLLSEETFPEALRLLDDDFVLSSPPGLPYGGEYHGQSGFIELLGRLTGMVTPGMIGEMEVLDAGEQVVVHATGTFTSVATGEVATTDLAELFTLRAGKITKMDIYYKDPAAVAAVVPRA